MISLRSVKELSDKDCDGNLLLQPISKNFVAKH